MPNSFEERLNETEQKLKEAERRALEIAWRLKRVEVEIGIAEPLIFNPPSRKGKDK